MRSQRRNASRISETEASAQLKAMSRRHVLQLASALGALTGSVVGARGQATYSSRPVHVLLGFAAGGSSDVIGRLLCQWLSERLGQTFIFDNRPGADGNIATEFVAHQPPDGNSLLWCTSANVINATLYHNFGFAPVAGVFRVPQVLEVNPSVPTETVPEFIAYAKAYPGRLNFASGGIGSTQHLAGELFKYMTAVEMTHVPYRGSAPALIDLIGGQVQVMFDLLPASIGYIRAGKVRALGLTTATRSEALPDLPTISQFLPGYEVSTWNGVVAPKNTPMEAINRLNGAINAGLADPTINGRLADLGATPLTMSPAEFGRFIVDETAKWAKILKFAGIHAR